MDNDHSIKAKRTQVKKGQRIVEGNIVGRGKNKTVIDPDEILKLSKLGCTIEEMSDWFQVPANTIKYNFSDIIAKGRSETKQALRRAQIALALKGNATMLIWLGKNLLGQSDQPLLNAESEQILPWITNTGNKDESL